MANLIVDPQQLFADSGAFLEISNKASEIAGFLSHAMSRFVIPGDDASQQFWNQWTGSTGGIVELLHGFGDGMDKTSSDLGDTAKLYALSDRVNAESVHLA